MGIARTDNVAEFVVAAVASVVLAKGSHENHADEADEEEDHHEGVEDGEPVNLQEAGRQCPSLSPCASVL